MDVMCVCHHVIFHFSICDCLMHCCDEDLTTGVYGIIVAYTKDFNYLNILLLNRKEK